MSLLPVGFGASGDDYTIDDSLRFRSSASAFLDRTNTATPTSTTVWTCSVWVKRGTLGTNQYILNAGPFNSGNNFEGFYFMSNDTLRVQLTVGNSQISDYRTNAVFRDTSAWYHFVIVRNGQAYVVYVNGVAQTFGTSTFGSNPSSWVNAATPHEIGNRLDGLQDFDGYITEFNCIDGQALDADDFGEYDANGTWKAKQYTGTYGTNGFYLNGVGVTDQSGNGNNWTNNNLNLSTSTATTYDQMKDTPSLVDENAGNFATLNPLYNSISTSYPTPALSEGNLAASTNSGSNWKTVPSTMYVSSGKWYAEVKVTYTDYPDSFIGFASSDFNGQNYAPSETAFGYQFHPSLGIRHNSTQLSAGTFTQGDVIGLALNMDNNELSWYKNGTLVYTATSVASGYWSIALTLIYTKTLYVNFGQRPFAYTPPTGFLKLNTFNLPDSTIEDGSDYFTPVLYTGNGATNHNITGVGFQPDWVWLKERSSTSFHQVLDAVRGAGIRLETNSTGVETTPSPVGLSSFDSDGFTVENNNGYNQSSQTYVAWNWKANGSGVSNNVGSIPSTVSVNTTAGFSIVSWSGNSTNGATIGHGLGTAPNIILTKCRSHATSWIFGIGGMSGFGVNDYLNFQTTGTKLSSTTFYQGYSANTFQVGVSSADEMNKTGRTYISYVFSEVPGYSAFGSYTGNTSTDGPFIYTGFRPAWVMLKRTDAAGHNWFVLDATRNSYNVLGAYLNPNTANAEASTTFFDFTSNGFKLRATSSGINTGTIIYMAFAENPFKNANAR